MRRRLCVFLLMDPVISPIVLTALGYAIRHWLKKDPSDALDSSSLLGDTADIFTGIGANFIHDALKSRTSDARAAASFLRNQHLDLFVAEVIKALILRFAADCADKKIKAQLTDLAKDIPEIWTHYADAGHLIIAKYQGQNFARLISNQLATKEALGTPDPEELAAFFKWIAAQSQYQQLLDSHALKYLTHDLAIKLPGALADALASSHPTAGPAFKKTLLRLQSQTLHDLAALRTEMMDGFDGIKEGLDKQRAYLAQISGYHSDLNKTLTQWKNFFDQSHAALAQFFDRDHDDLAAIEKTIEESSDEIAGLRADLRRHLKTTGEIKDQITALQGRQVRDFTLVLAVLSGVERRLSQHITDQHRLTREFVAELLQSGKAHLEAQPQGRHSWDYQLLCYAQSIPSRYGAPRILNDDSLAVPGDAFDITDVFVQPLTSLVRHEEKDRSKVRDSSVLVKDAPLSDGALQKLFDGFFLDRPLPALAPLRHPLHRLHVLLGDPGYGKSSILHMIVHRWRQCLGGHLRRPRAGRAAPPVPIIIEIRHYLSKCQHHHDLPFLDYLCGDYGHGYHFQRHDLEAALAAGRAWLLFDGLDEAFHLDVRHDIAANIQSLAREHDQARFIITSRRIGFEPDSWHRASWMIRLIDDFDQERMVGLVRRFDAIQRFSPQFHDEILPLVLDSIVTHAHTQDLGRNPLLLTLLCLVASSGGLPEDRLTLYQRAVEYFITKLDHWKSPRDHDHEMRALRDRARGDGSLYTDQHKRDLLCHAAWEMQGTSERWDSNFIPTKDIGDHLLHTLTQLRWSDPQRGSEEELRLMQERNYLLTERGDGTLMFIHRTFLEFFAALHELPRLTGLHQLDEKERKKRLDTHFHDLIATRWQSDTWTVMIEFLFGLVDQPTATALGQRFLRLKNKAEQYEVTLFASRLCLARGRGKGAAPGDPKDIADALGLRGILRGYLAAFGADKDVTEIYEDDVAERATELLLRLWPQDQDLMKDLRQFAADSTQNADTRARVVQVLARIHSGQEWLRELLHSIATRADSSSRLRNMALTRLDIGWGAKELHLTLPGLSALTELEELWLNGCTGLEALPDLSGLKQLRRLLLRGCTGLKGAGAFAGLSAQAGLGTLYLDGCTGLEALPDLRGLKQLRVLSLRRCTSLHGPDALSGLTWLGQLERLDIEGCTGLESLPDLSAMKRLKRLNLRGCTGLKNRDGVKERVPPGCRIIGP